MWFRYHHVRHLQRGQRVPASHIGARTIALGGFPGARHGGVFQPGVGTVVGYRNITVCTPLSQASGAQSRLLCEVSPQGRQGDVGNGDLSCRSARLRGEADDFESCGKHADICITSNSLKGGRMQAQ